MAWIVVREYIRDAGKESYRGPEQRERLVESVTQLLAIDWVAHYTTIPGFKRFVQVDFESGLVAQFRLPVEHQGKVADWHTVATLNRPGTYEESEGKVTVARGRVIISKMPQFHINWSDGHVGRSWIAWWAKADRVYYRLDPITAWMRRHPIYQQLCIWAAITIAYALYKWTVQFR